MPKRFLAASYAAALAMLALAGTLVHAGAAFWLALPLPAFLLGWQVARLTPSDPASCLRLFKLNRETGLAVAAALLAAHL